MWTLSDEGRNMLEETTEEVKLPIDMQSKNSMVDVARNKAAIDYCAYPHAVFHILVYRLVIWKAQLLLFRGNISLMTIRRV